MKTAKRKPVPPKRGAHVWERVCFGVPPDLKVGLEHLTAAYGESQGAFLRYLIRQELRASAQKSAPSTAS
jgi:hypothetical protein